MGSLFKDARAAVAAYKTTKTLLRGGSEPSLRDAQREVRGCVWRLARHCLITCGDDAAFVKTLDELNDEHRVVEECMRAGGSGVEYVREMLFPVELQNREPYIPGPEPELSDYFQAVLNPEFVDRLERLCTWSPAGYAFWTHEVMATVNNALWVVRHGDVQGAYDLLNNPLDDEEARACYIAMRRGPGKIKDRVASCPPAFQMPIVTLAVMCALHDTDADAVYFLRDVADYKLDLKVKQQRQRNSPSSWNDANASGHVTFTGEIASLVTVASR